jgi:hypothetical protein
VDSLEQKDIRYEPRQPGQSGLQLTGRINIRIHQLWQVYHANILASVTNTVA